MVPDNVSEMVLYAWVGEDEHGSGEVGLKQGIVPAGVIPLVACKDGKVDQNYIVDQLQRQADTFGKPIRLCRFVFSEQLMVINPHEYAKKVVPVVERTTGS